LDRAKASGHFAFVNALSHLAARQPATMPDTAGDTHDDNKAAAMDGSAAELLFSIDW